MNGWIPVVGTLLGTALGIWGSWWKEEHRRKATRRALWTALGCEIEVCRKEATTYLAARIDAPAYRLPVKAFESAAFKLLEDGAMDADDYTPLLDFFHVVNQANRVLDLVQAARERDDTDGQAKEVGRARMKMDSLVTGREGRPPLYPPAAKVVRDHLLTLG